MPNPNPDRHQTILDWQDTFGSPPPRYLSVGFMQKALAYEAQCKVSGGLPVATRRALKQVASGKSVQSINAGRISTGAHLVREWNGRTYQVEVVDGGYKMDGKPWPSLSAIAKHITGTTWSGPRFFGLNSRAGEQS
jgi:hypothetical protein